MRDLARCFYRWSTLGVVTVSVAFGQTKGDSPRNADPGDSETKGRQLVAELLRLRPEPSTNTGVLRIRPRGSSAKEIPLRIEVFVTATNWGSVYQTGSVGPSPNGTRLVVVHTEGISNQYWLNPPPSSTNASGSIPASESMVPFADSDFWLSDLGLEFLRWPVQRLLRQEMRLSQPCNVLESLNPRATPGTYARVVSWIDIENGAIVHADAYDPKGEMLKQFAPTELKKVNGQRQVEELEMRNRTTGSRSWIKFDLRAQAAIRRFSRPMVCIAMRTPSLNSSNRNGLAT